jgi:uncharacterized protein (TIGR04255 family)
MNDLPLHLKAAPIVEAVLDIDCDMPLTMDVAALETSARAVYGEQYPKFQPQFMQEFMFEAPAEGAAKVTKSSRGIQALQFLQGDGKQLVQVRAQGYSFNRLAPYGSLDDYLPEMERTWGLFAAIAQPVKIRAVRLRYINRLLLPFEAGRLELDEYFVHAPRLPSDAGLEFTGFVHQHSAVEVETGNQVHLVLAGQPREQEKLPVIFDIQTFHSGDMEPLDWQGILSRVGSLRRLKNLVFRKSLTEKCLNLFL